MDGSARLLPENMHAVFLSGNRFIPYEPSECDPKLLKKGLTSFSDPRLDGVSTSKAELAFFADMMSMSQRSVLNGLIAPMAIEALEAAVAADALDSLFDMRCPSSEAEVPGALTTREAVQAEIDTLRGRFGIEQPVHTRFVTHAEDVPGSGIDASFGFQGLPFLPRPSFMEIIFTDEYLTYPSKYRTYLLQHEFAHCLQVLDGWPYLGDEDEHHDESFARACAKLGVEPKEGSFYPAGSYRIVCQRCGDTKYATESETLRTQGVSMAEFTREFVCPLCYGSIRAERIDAPVFAIGTEVFEVGPDGEACKLIGTVQRP